MKTHPQSGCYAVDFALLMLVWQAVPVAFLDYRDFCTVNSPWNSLTRKDLRRLAYASPAEQECAFVGLVLRNPKIRSVLEHVAEVGIPEWCLTAGALFQTVWNVAAGHDDPNYGIRDFDLFYYDDTDLSYEAEDTVIRRCLKDAHRLGDVALEPRNQARVHIWYEGKYGRRIEPYKNLVDPISTFAFTCCSVALSLSRDGKLTVYSTHGYTDLFLGVLRRSPTSIVPEQFCLAKSTTYRSRWPHLVEAETQHASPV